ncbi:MAG TPA: hypothetical protein VFU19_04300, partial [Iamia sp.]|nr:hypothetical protein [Iamia sp.]
MTLHGVLVVAAAAVLGANVGLLVIAAGHHLVAARRDRRRQRIRDELRPLLVRLVAEEDAALPAV